MFLSKNFKESEFTCHCGQCLYSRYPKMDFELISLAEHIRTFVKFIDSRSYVYVTCGRRCVHHNEKVGGAKLSTHIEGKAFDFKTPFVPLEKVYAYLCKTYPKTYGFGIYNTFIHADVKKGDPRRWNKIK